MKHCKKCNQDKPINEFNKNQRWCKRCAVEYASERQRKLKHGDAELIKQKQAIDERRDMIKDGVCLCRECDRVKPLSEFNRLMDGRVVYTCRDCNTKRGRKYKDGLSDEQKQTARENGNARDRRNRAKNASPESLRRMQHNREQRDRRKPQPP